MSNNQLFIPTKIKAGFQLRKGTYSGKLAYVIGHDGKKWRKEPSWESWRQKVDSTKRNWNRDKQEYEYEEIHTEGVEPLEMQNIPTSGFCLNKKVGGDSWGWNPRQTYCRVYDPRGFEFEITVPNLLFILQETNSIKGKALEGEFVYSWDGKDLVLLPVESQEYKNSMEFTELQSQKITKKDMVVGCNYLDKNQNNLMYLGYYLIYDEYYNFCDSEDKEQDSWYKRDQYKSAKHHVFYDEQKEEFVFYRSYSVQIKKRLTEAASLDFSNLLDKFLYKTKFSSKAVKIEFSSIEEIDTGAYFYKYYKRYRVSKNKDGRYDFNNHYYSRSYEGEDNLTEEQVKQKFEYKYRVYENGFKQQL